MRCLHVPELASRNRQNYKSLKFVKLGLCVCVGRKKCASECLLLLLLMRVSVCLYIVSVAIDGIAAPTDSNVVVDAVDCQIH